MSEVPYRVVLLDSSHNRKGFHSRVAPLDEYLHTVVSQDVKRRAATCYVALDKDDRIAGYYTVAMQHINLPDLPDDLRKKLPRYPTVPAVIMGRLAVDLAFKGIGLGGALLGNALNRMARSEFASYAMVVDAKDQSAFDFYQHHGFQAFAHEPMKMFLPIATWLKAQPKI